MWHHLKNFDLAAGGVQVLRVLSAFILFKSVNLDPERNSFLSAVFPRGELCTYAMNLQWGKEGKIINVEHMIGSTWSTFKSIFGSISAQTRMCQILTGMIFTCLKLDRTLSRSRDNVKESIALIRICPTYLGLQDRLKHVRRYWHNICIAPLSVRENFWPMKFCFRHVLFINYTKQLWWSW